MTQPAHLTDEQMTRYRNSELTPPELLDLDSHLSACADCRGRLYTANRSTAGLRELRSDFSEHLEYADVVRCSEGSGNPEHLEHLRECSRCQSEVQDLSRFRTELEDTTRRPTVISIKPWVRYRFPAGIAAAMLLVAGGSFFALRHASAPKPAAPAPVEHAEAAIPAPEREVLERALATGKLERSPILEGLLSKPGTLLGSAARQARIDLLSPVGTGVLTDRPLLRWTPVDGASSYVVSIFDEKFQKLQESPALETTEWRAQPLPRNTILNWQVIAKTRNGTVRAPAPPAPEARFRILPPEVAQRIERIRHDHPGNPLLLAALYAHEGAIEDAQVMLQAVDQVTAQSYLESLRKIRRGD
jgi:hypothetical protein